MPLRTLMLAYSGSTTFAQILDSKFEGLYGLQHSGLIENLGQDFHSRTDVNLDVIWI